MRIAQFFCREIGLPKDHPGLIPYLIKLNGDEGLTDLGFVAAVSVGEYQQIGSAIA
jgi:hypothetical protein